MAYVLTGTRYIGTGALPTPVAGYDAVDTTTGNRYDANTSATAWNLVGNVNQTNEGMLPLTGGTMTGAITGATGWAPLDSPNFTTSAKLGGLDLVTSTTLSTAITNVNNGISPKITSAVASLSAGISVNSSIAKAKGTLTPSSVGATITVPPPTYSDGTTANIADCVWSIGVYSIPDQGNGLKSIAITNPGGANVYTAVATRDDGVQTSPTMSYVIIGVKP